MKPSAALISWLAQFGLVALFMAYTTYSSANKVPHLEVRTAAMETKQAVFEERVANMDKTLGDIKRLLERRLPLRP